MYDLLLVMVLASYNYTCLESINLILRIEVRALLVIWTILNSLSSSNFVAYSGNSCTFAFVALARSNRKHCNECKCCERNLFHTFKNINC